jgi:hypothetical protein
LLLAKSAQDEFVLDLMLNEPQTPLEPFGFHAQQATEKLLKAAIKALGGEYPLTHDLHRLVLLVDQAGAPVPGHLLPLRDLTPFAAALRYDPLPDGDTTALDRHVTRRQIAEMRTWVQGLAAGGR